MAKLRRRRRRRSRRGDAGEEGTVLSLRARPPSAKTAAMRDRIDETLRGGRAGPLRLDATEKALESDADRVAARIVSQGPAVGPASIGGAAVPPPVQAKTDGAASAGGSPMGAPNPAHGVPLPRSEKSRFSGPLGDSLDGVRIDTSASAHRLTDRLGAKAVTIGSRIAFGAGRFAPGTRSGDALLAHELVHTVQQKRAGRRAVQRKDDKAKHGAISGQGGLIGDDRRQRMNVIVKKGDTLTAIASKLVGFWTASESELTSEQRAAVNPEVRTAEGLAKAILVHNQFYLRPPTMPAWRTGLRLPLPMRKTQAGDLVVNAPLAGLWIKSFKAEWAPALKMPAAAAAPQKELDEDDKTFLAGGSDRLGILLSTKALTNAKEAEPLIRGHLGKGDLKAGKLAMSFMSTITNSQIEVLAGQPEGQAIIAMIRRAVTANAEALKATDEFTFKRTITMLDKTTAAFDPVTAKKTLDAYVAQTGNHCMTACYMGVGEIYGEEAKKKLTSEVRRKDRAAPKVDLKNVITIMEAMQELGRAGPPMVFNQKVGTTKFDNDPDAAFTALIAELKGQPGFYFFGMSVVSGYHTVMLALDLTNPAAPKLIWMDQYGSKIKQNKLGKLKEELRKYASWARDSNPKYSPLETKIWQLFPPSRLVLPLN